MNILGFLSLVRIFITKFVSTDQVEPLKECRCYRSFCSRFFVCKFSACSCLLVDLTVMKINCCFSSGIMPLWCLFSFRLSTDLPAPSVSLRVQSPGWGQSDAVLSSKRGLLLRDYAHVPALVVFLPLSQIRHSANENNFVELSSFTKF